MNPTTLTSSESDKELKAEFLEIDPEMASEFLKENTQNRPQREARITRYSKLMQDEEWLPSPDAIAFDHKGRLINGQHRLKAIQKSGTSVIALVVYNLPTDAMHISDVGIKRTPADVLAIEGFSSPHELAATIRLVALWLKDRDEQSWKYGLKDCNKYEIVENTSIVDIAERCNDRLENAVDIANKHKTGLKDVPFPRSLAAFGYFVYEPTYGRRARTFIEKLATGENIMNWGDQYEEFEDGTKSPVKLLRDKMRKSEKGTGSLSREEKLAYMVQAMNWYCKEEGHKRLRYHKSRGDSFHMPDVDMIPEFRDQLELSGV